MTDFEAMDARAARTAIDADHADVGSECLDAEDRAVRPAAGAGEPSNVVDHPTRKKPGPPPGSAKPPGSGRKRGTTNFNIANRRDRIARRSKVELLVTDVAAGKRTVEGLTQGEAIRMCWKAIIPELRAVEIDATNTNTNEHTFTTAEDRAAWAEDWRQLIDTVRPPAPPTDGRAAFKAALESPTEPEPKPPLAAGDVIEAAFSCRCTALETPDRYGITSWKVERAGKIVKASTSTTERGIRGFCEARGDEEGWPDAD